MGFRRGSRDMSVPLNQFTPHRLHRMYVLRVTLGFWQNGQSGSIPTSLIRSSGVISYQVFCSIVPSPGTTLCTVGRYNLTPQPDVFTLFTYPDSCSRFHVCIVNNSRVCCKRYSPPNAAKSRSAAAPVTLTVMLEPPPTAFCASFMPMRSVSCSSAFCCTL